jgi:hypothetical protein
VRVNSPDSTVPRDADFQEGFSVQLRLARHQGRLHGSASPPSAGRHIKIRQGHTAAARDRKIAAGEKCGGRKSYAEARPEMVELARKLRRPYPDRRPVSLRKVSAALAERGYGRQPAGRTKLRLWRR